MTGVSGCSLQLIHIRVWNYFEDLQRPRRQSEDNVRVRPYVRMHCVAFLEGYWVYTSNAISHRRWRWVLLWAKDQKENSSEGLRRGFLNGFETGGDHTVIRESLGWWVESFGLARRTSERECCGGAVPGQSSSPRANSSSSRDWPPAASITFRAAQASCPPEYTATPGFYLLPNTSLLETSLSLHSGHLELLKQAQKTAQPHPEVEASSFPILVASVPL